MASFGGFVYMLLNPQTDRLYIGVTSNLLTRMQQHLHGKIPGYALRHSCRTLVFYECFPTIVEAIAREKQLKRWSRQKKNSLIKLVNPSSINLISDEGSHDILPVVEDLPKDLDTRFLMDPVFWVKEN